MVSPAAARLAAKGRLGDTLIGHLTKGDIVVPEEKVSPQVRGVLGMLLGRQLERFTAGSPANSRNPKTGLPEFEGTGGEGEGEGPGSDGPTGGAGPGSTGGPGTGAATGHESETAIDAQHDQPVSDTVSQTGLSGLVNDVQNAVQSKVTAIQNDPVSELGKLAINGLVGTVPGIGIANSVAGLMGAPTMGSVISGAVKGAFNGIGSGAPGAAGPADPPGDSSGGLLSVLQPQTPAPAPAAPPVLAPPALAAVAPPPPPPLWWTGRTVSPLPPLPPLWWMR
jgi:hypothetical protein